MLRGWAGLLRCFRRRKLLLFPSVLNLHCQVLENLVTISLLGRFNPPCSLLDSAKIKTFTLGGLGGSKR